MSPLQHVHMKTVTITELRRNIFRLIDETLETGEPIVLNRKGKRVVLSAERTLSPAAETEAAREARWRRFWATPSEINEDLTLEEIEAAGEAYWHWSNGPEPVL
jgi:prevent-host-death family protein